jgi:hypothetical protein
MTVSNKFALLPNGIIREIVAYTGATYKKRNGKYIGQIPKDDPRYTVIETVPKMKVITFTTLGTQILHCEAILTRCDNNYDYCRTALVFIAIIRKRKINGVYKNDFIYRFEISSLNPDPTLPYERKYIYEEGVSFEQQKFFKKYRKYISFAVDTIWLGISCWVGWSLFTPTKNMSIAVNQNGCTTLLYLSSYCW